MINSLGFYDCFFIFEACFQALIKIHKLGIEYIPDEIDNIINARLIIIERIDYNQFKTLILNCQEINDLMSNFNLETLIKNDKKQINVKKFKYFRIFMLMIMNKI